MNESNTPNHVAIIMDGNRRWAREKGLKDIEGHKQGAETLKKLADHILNQGVKCLSVFAFSTENFKRSEEEVGYLMNLFVKELNNTVKDFNKKNVKVVISGSKDNLNDNVIDSINNIEELTGNNTAGTVNICLNYGGQKEIVDASKKIAEQVQNGELNINDLNEQNFYNYLYHSLPPIDLVIRTSGELRISNFLIYQLAYAELYFTNVYFPDFLEDEFDKALEDFKNRTRKFGGNK